MHSITSFVTVLALLAPLASAAPFNKRSLVHRGQHDWWSGLEPYKVYNTRYMALGCKFQHNTQFFEDCCHPMLKDQLLSSRPDKCDPAKVPYTGATGTVVGTETAAPESTASVTTTTAPASTQSSSVGGEDDCEELDEEDDDDEGEDDDYEYDEDCEEETSSVPAPVSTQAPVTVTSAPVVASPTSTKAVIVQSPSSSKAPTTSKTSPTSTSAQPAQTGGNGGGEVITGGFATFYSQNGVAGACGKKNPDSAMIGAIDYRRWGNGNGDFSQPADICGKEIRITNPKNGKSVNIIIADVCPSCKNKNSIDLSEGAFDKIATREEGMVEIEWSFVN